MKKSSYSLLLIILFSLIILPNGDLRYEANLGSILESKENNLVKQQVVIDGDSLILNSSTIEMVLDLDKSGSISFIRNVLTSKEIELDQESIGPLWSFELIDFRYYDTYSSSTFDYTIVNSKKVELEYQILIDSELMIVLVTIQLDEPHVGINFNINITSSESHPGISRATIPHITAVKGWARNSSIEQIAFPDRTGWLVQDSINSILDYGFYREYPGTMSMQFFVLVEPKIGGFVLSSYDSRSRHKEFVIDGYNWGDRTIQMWISHTADNMRFEKSNNFTMDYWVALQGYAGNSWAEGAELYKDWALDQWYVDKGPIASRNDTPTWLKEIDYIWKGSSYATNHITGELILEGDTVDNIGLLANSLHNWGLSNNLLIEWWGWGKGGFDRDFPEYYPPKDGDLALLYGIADAHIESAKVMLYFNGRLVDITTDTYANNTEYMTGFYDDIYTETYNPYFTAALPDPASAWWQETVKNFTKRAIEFFGADGVYLDQISVAPPQFDYRNVTTHPPGGGSWWQEAQNQLLADVRQELKAVNNETIMSSENILETYLRYLDHFWIYQLSFDLGAHDWFPNGKSIPLFSYVYHKYTSFGGWADIHPTAMNHFIWAISERVLRGYIPGSTGMPSIDSFDPNPFSIVSNAYNTRKIDNYSFFRDGDLLFPVEWEGSPIQIITQGSKTIHVPYGAIQGFKNNKDEIALVFSNRRMGSLEWSGNLKKLLIDSGVGIPEYSKANVSIYENGNLLEISEKKLEEDFSYTVPICSFIVFLINNITESEPPTEKTAYEEILTLSIPITIMTLVVLRRKRIPKI
jgi:hypothetical protein